MVAIKGVVATVAAGLTPAWTVLAWLMRTGGTSASSRRSCGPLLTPVSICPLVARSSSEWLPA
jgi:hypothetical protein